MRRKEWDPEGLAANFDETGNMREGLAEKAIIGCQTDAVFRCNNGL